MARYIDADALKLDIDLSKGANVLDMAISIIKAVKEAPTADVVPKSEVATEIFEEIERAIGEKYDYYVFDNRDIEGIEQDAIIAFADTMQKHFDELKKKYTEGKT